MKRNLSLILLTLFVINGYCQSVSPEILSSAGETFQGMSMKIDWTLGELAITTIQNPSIRVTQGFHQPSYLVTSIDELTAAIGNIQVYPNPTSDWLEINLSLDKKREVQIQLLDAKGKLIWTKTQKGHRFSEKKTLTKLPAGNYFLNFLIDENQFSQTFKIQKLN